MEQENDDRGEPTRRGGSTLLSADSLVGMVEARGGVSVLLDRYKSTSGASTPVLRRLRIAYYRAQKSGSLTLWAADELAVRLLDEHPLMVFADEWVSALGDYVEHDTSCGAEGTMSAYVQGCRCIPCGDARRRYRAGRRAAKASSSV